MIVKVK